MTGARSPLSASLQSEHGGGRGSAASSPPLSSVCWRINEGLRAPGIFSGLPSACMGCPPMLLCGCVRFAVVGVIVAMVLVSWSRLLCLFFSCVWGGLFGFGFGCQC